MAVSGIPPPLNTPDGFAQFLVQNIVPALADVVRNALKEAPAKLHDVTRQTPSGPVARQITLATIMTELTDVMQINNELQRHLIQSNNVLITELRESTRIGREMLKKKRRRDDDEE